MATTKKNVQLRVVADGVPLLEGKMIPIGVYPGTIEVMHISLHGQTIDRVSRVMINLTEKQIAAALGVAPDPMKLGMGFDVTPHYDRGSIQTA